MKSGSAQFYASNVRIIITFVMVFAFLFNFINFRADYFLDVWHFLAYTFITSLACSIYIILYKAVSHFFRLKYPEEKQTYLRLGIFLFYFLIILGLLLYALLQIFEHNPWFNYKYSEEIFFWNYFTCSIINTFFTFFLEGYRNYREWNENSRENEKLDAAYRQSRLQALKSQVNPHFLFNSLNSLSSLIQEDEEKAEAFLNEMSKVYRYMLRNDEEQWVTLETELKFISSYMHLLNARYGSAIQLKTKVNEEHLNLMIAQLTLQVIIENTFTQNSLSKTSPLDIIIQSAEGRQLLVQNNVQPKTITNNTTDVEDGLDNLVTKYKIMGSPFVVDDQHQHIRTIRIQLLEKKEVLT